MLGKKKNPESHGVKKLFQYSPCNNDNLEILDIFPKKKDNPSIFILSEPTSSFQSQRRLRLKHVSACTYCKNTY